MLSVISNTSYFQDNQLINAVDISIDKGLISAIKTTDYGAQSDTLTVPGFIDLQIYGAAGRLFSADPTIESLTIIENELLKNGTTGFLICLATNTPEVFNTCIQTVKEHAKNAKNCLGLHLEGPFLNPKRRGAHIENFIRKATLDEIKELLDFGDGSIKMMTLAPELQDDAVIRYLLDHQVVLSLGHSDASYEQATAAYNQGIQSTTHLFNAMSPIHHRQPGIPTALYNHPTAKASIIVDNEHVSYEVVKFSKKLLKERLFLITDAVTECATGPYQHQLKGEKFVMPDGTLSGSSLTMLQAVKNCVHHCDISLPEALKMATQYPAELIGIDHLTGTITQNHQANLVLLDQNLHIQKIIFNGQTI
ncbi:N-acetylglucosamine-6-phosphate deacetylase [Pedobacter sp. MW01-1-1]|uniref:N-acetylglucosamine-6-phosphate deacetylase n=1 Tax=Pedobacter sp. MW01-1-1 TaxID=3383027 RepID=UPI003FEE2B15